MRNRHSEFNPSRSSTSGSMAVAGVLTVGQVTGCATVSGYGIQNNSLSLPLSLVSNVSNAANNISNKIVANVNNATIDNNHIMMQIAWRNNLGACTGSWNFKPYSIEAGSGSNAELYGTDTDGASSIACIVGSEKAYTTAGAKLLSVVNSGSSGTERAYVDYTGSLVFCMSSNGGYTAEKYVSEVLTMISGAGTTSSVYIPAGAMSYAVGVRVIADFPISGSTFPSSSLFSVGTVTTTDKWGTGIPTTAGSTNLTSSMKSGWEYVSADTYVVIRPQVYNSNLTATSGSVRLELRYRQVNPPTS